MRMATARSAGRGSLHEIFIRILDLDLLKGLDKRGCSHKSRVQPDRPKLQLALAMKASALFVALVIGGKGLQHRNALSVAPQGRSQAALNKAAPRGLYTPRGGPVAIHETYIPQLTSLSWMLRHATRGSPVLQTA